MSYATTYPFIRPLGQGGSTYPTRVGELRYSLDLSGETYVVWEITSSGNGSLLVLIFVRQPADGLLKHPVEVRLSYALRGTLGEQSPAGRDAKLAHLHLNAIPDSNA